MSDENTKQKRSKRLLKEENAINRQVKIAKQAHVNAKVLEQPHRFSKHHAMNCGNPKCILCANPRKTFKEKTIQEKKFEQKELYD